MSSQVFLFHHHENSLCSYIRPYVFLFPGLLLHFGGVHLPTVSLQNTCMRNTFFEVLCFWKYLNPIFILFLVWLVIEMAWKWFPLKILKELLHCLLTSVFAVLSLAICDHFSSLNLQDISLSLGSEIPWWYAMHYSGARNPPRCWSLSASFDFGTQVFSFRKVSWIVSLISSPFHYFLFLEFLWVFFWRGEEEDLQFLEWSYAFLSVLSYFLFLKISP